MAQGVFRTVKVNEGGGCGCDACLAKDRAAAANVNRNEPPAPPSFDTVDSAFRDPHYRSPEPQPSKNPSIEPDYAEAARVQHLPDVRYPINPADAAASGFGVMPVPSPLSPEDFKK